LELGESDHRPLVTYISDTVKEQRRSFYYDHRLVHKDGFKDSVLRGWNGSSRQGTENINLSDRVSKCRQHISRWKRQHKTNAEDQIWILRYKLDKASSCGTTALAEIQKLKKNLNQAYIDEEMFWKHKSRNQWTHEGDGNTKYFHTVTKTRRARNKIVAIEDKDGMVKRGDNAIAEVAAEYFQDLFSTSATSEAVHNDIFEDFPKRVSQEMNRDLTRSLTQEEIKSAVFSIGPHRAPGPDGFSAAFYQHFWNDINPSIIKEVESFFDTGLLDQQHNHTNICLIPKTEAPTSMKEFRPIALCNVSYKIISKILVNHLKTHLSSVISDNQAAFIPGRMITDNNIIAHEVFHALKARKRQSKSYMALKTDITKAYDRLEWNFLKSTMEHMGFDARWIQWIMTCVSSVSFSVLINGSPRMITPARGIRQGDPMSPYLFILCAEVLSHMLQQAEKKRHIQGIKICDKGPAITHLLFANDSLFFMLTYPRNQNL